MHRLSGLQIGDRIARQFLRIILETSTQELTRPEQAFGAPQTQAVERARIEPQHFIQKTFGFIQNLPVELHSIEIKHQQFGELDPGVEPARSFRKPLYATPQAVNGVGPILEFDLGETFAVMRFSVSRILPQGCAIHNRSLPVLGAPEVPVARFDELFLEDVRGPRASYCYQDQTK